MAYNRNVAAAELPSGGAAAAEVPEATRVPFGKAVRRLFLFTPGYLNMNHGSYGSIPRSIQAKLREYQDAIEARPDVFVRYEYAALLDRNRQAAAALLKAPLDTVVLVPNATTAINIVLRNLVWGADGRDDEILYFSTIYGACNRVVDYVTDTRGGAVHGRRIDLTYPVEDDDILAAFRAAVAAAEEAGRRAAACVFDVVSSVPGVRFPFERLTRACRELGVLSVVDGAQGIGMIEFDLAELDPDFFWTNCHKWLHAPRGSAVLYVPLRHQAALPATLPVSHAYVPAADRPTAARSAGAAVAPTGTGLTGKAWTDMFEWVGTVDSSPFLCVADAIQWRREVLGGEAAVVRYLTGLARAGGQACATVLGTEALDNATHTLSECSFSNVRLPLAVSGDNASDTGAAGVPWTHAPAVAGHMQKVLVDEYNAAIVVYAYQQQFWTRLSAQVYLDVDDFRRAGEILLDLCARVERGEWQTWIRL